MQDAGRTHGAMARASFDARTVLTTAQREQLDAGMKMMREIMMGGMGAQTGPAPQDQHQHR